MKLNSAFGHQCVGCKRKIPPPSPPAWECIFCDTRICVWCYHEHTKVHDPKVVFYAPAGERMVSKIIEVEPGQVFDVHIGVVGEATTIKESE